MGGQQHCKPAAVLAQMQCADLPSAILSAAVYVVLQALCQLPGDRTARPVSQNGPRVQRMQAMMQGIRLRPQLLLDQIAQPSAENMELSTPGENRLGAVVSQVPVAALLN